MNVEEDSISPADGTASAEAIYAFQSRSAQFLLEGVLPDPLPTERGELAIRSARDTALQLSQLARSAAKTPTASSSVRAEHIKCPLLSR